MLILIYLLMIILGVFLFIKGLNKKQKINNFVTQTTIMTPTNSANFKCKFKKGINNLFPDTLCLINANNENISIYPLNNKNIIQLNSPFIIMSY